MPTGKACAEHLFLSEVTFYDLIKREVISKQPAGKYEFDVVREEYIRYIREIASRRSGSDEKDLNLTDERAKLAREQREKIAMENEVSRKTLIPAELIKKTGEKIFTAIRAKILASSLLNSEKDELLAELRGINETDWI